MSKTLKGKELPILVMWIVVLVVFSSYFFGGSTLESAFKTLTVDWAIIITNIAIVVGSLALMQRSITLARREKSDKVDRFMQIWTVVLAVILFIIGTTLGIKSNIYSWIYNYILLPSWQTVYTLIIFFMATASYRAYRANNNYAVVLLISGVLVLMRNAPVGASIWSGFQDLGSWVLDVVNLSGSRAIMIGAMIGAISLLIKILTGREKILGE